MTDINKYLDFVLKLFFAFGFAFEIPVGNLLGYHHWTWCPKIASKI
jgi:Sec-independent protein secretion pathway component TatC